MHNLLKSKNLKRYNPFWLDFLAAFSRDTLHQTDKPNIGYIKKLNESNNSILSLDNAHADF